MTSALISSSRNKPLPHDLAVFGEVGLSGEIRGIPQAPLRIREAVQMGFNRIVMPFANVEPDSAAQNEGCELVGVRTLGEALDNLIA